MKIVMEKSWNMKNWPKVMEFCDSVMELYQFCPQFVLNLHFFDHHSDLESLHFLTFSAKRHKFKIGERVGHGKSRKGHGKIFCQVCGNPELEKARLIARSSDNGCNRCLAYG